MSTSENKEQPVIPGKDKQFPANHMPPKGIEAFQMFRDHNHWSVWAFRVKEDGNIETEKVMERELFERARVETLRRMVDSQISQIK